MQIYVWFQMLDTIQDLKLCDKHWAFDMKLNTETMIAYIIHAFFWYTPSMGEYHVNSMHCALRFGSSIQSGHADYMNTSPHFQ